MTQPLISAQLQIRADGTPVSALYDDIHRSASGGADQCCHVFLGGNDLPQRWAGRDDFSILETGFGLGLNFLVTWQAWLADPRRCGRLHFVSIEKHPLTREDLMRSHEALHRDCPERAALAARLIDVWPGALPGVHRLLLGEGGLTLTLVIGDIGEMIGALRLGADAIYLDGFAPDRNPQMWDVRVLRHCARLSRPGATLATYTAARQVCEQLESAGFEVERLPGFGGKRHMLKARPRWQAASPAVRVQGQAKQAVVIGAGIAGAAVVDRLAVRGWQVTLLDREAEPASGASGLWLGALHPHFSQDDCLLSRTSRAAMVLAVQRFNEWLAHDAGCGWHPCGVAHPATSVEEESALRVLCARLALPAEVVAFLERDALSEKAGAAMPHGGYWHARTGVVDVRRLIGRLIAQPGTRWMPQSAVARLHRDGPLWQALDAQGRVLAQADVMIVANAGDANRLLPALETLHPVRGQMTAVSASVLRAPKAAVVGFGYVLPAVDGRVSLGATYDPGTLAQDVREEDHRLNLQSLAVLMPQTPPLPPSAPMEAFVGTRFAAKDHLPLIGPVPDLSDSQWLARAAGKRLTDLPRQPGLYCAVGYGSRGLSWSVLAGEILASHLEGEPAPLESALMDALDPARFVMRAVRRSI